MFRNGYEVVKKVKMWPPTDPTGLSSRITLSFPGGRVTEKIKNMKQNSAINKVCDYTHTIFLL